MRDKKIGMELGIRAPMKAIQRAAIIADENKNYLNYFFVPETNPKFIGVDAFEAINSLTQKVKNISLGTGIVNIFSRTQQEVLELSANIYNKSSKKFVLGLGTSAPVIVEDMYKIKFEKPVFRITQYTNYLKSKYRGPIFWAAIGDKITELAAQYADGVIFFLKPESQIKHSIRIIQNKLTLLGKSPESFEIISIRPTFLSSLPQEAKNAARITIAGYVGANEFYSEPIRKAGFEKEVSEIRKNFKSSGLLDASKKVSDRLIEQLATFGTAKECQAKLNQHSHRTDITTLVAGFDLPEESYDEEFFENLSELVNGI